MSKDRKEVHDLMSDGLSVTWEFLPGDLNHRETVAVVLLSLVKYIEHNRDCCMQEGPDVILKECLGHILSAQKGEN
jgi:hypothetical protein